MTTTHAGKCRMSVRTAPLFSRRSSARLALTSAVCQPTAQVEAACRAVKRGAVSAAQPVDQRWRARKDLGSPNAGCNLVDRTVSPSQISTKIGALCRDGASSHVTRVLIVLARFLRPRPRPFASPSSTSGLQPWGVLWNSLDLGCLHALDASYAPSWVWSLFWAAPTHA
jgi:hypothetical protein